MVATGQRTNASLAFDQIDCQLIFSYLGVGQLNWINDVLGWIENDTLADDFNEVVCSRESSIRLLNDAAK